MPKRHWDHFEQFFQKPQLQTAWGGTPHIPCFPPILLGVEPTNQPRACNWFWVVPHRVLGACRGGTLWAQKQPSPAFTKCFQGLRSTREGCHLACAGPGADHSIIVTKAVFWLVSGSRLHLRLSRKPRQSGCYWETVPFEPYVSSHMAFFVMLVCLFVFLLLQYVSITRADTTLTAINLECGTTWAYVRS